MKHFGLQDELSQMSIRQFVKQCPGFDSYTLKIELICSDR
jgi:hypothetical protein